MLKCVAQEGGSGSVGKLVDEEGKTRRVDGAVKKERLGDLKRGKGEIPKKGGIFIW